MHDEPMEDGPEPRTVGKQKHGLPIRVGLWMTGGFCILFGAVDLVLSTWKLHELRGGSILDFPGPIVPALIVVYGGDLLFRSVRPKSRRTLPALVLALGVSIMLGVLAAWNPPAPILDENIVQAGSYPDFCPDRTIEDLLQQRHDQVAWASYLDKYGYRAVRASCFDGDLDPALVLVWTIDEDDRFWLQFAVEDGRPVDPYIAIASLCAPERPTPNEDEQPRADDDDAR